MTSDFAAVAAASAAAVLAALLIDMAFGDQRSRFHPTAWAGALIAWLVPAPHASSHMRDRLAGACAVILPVCIVVCVLVLLEAGLDAITGLAHALAWGMISAILLKTTIAVRGMQMHAMAVVSELEQGRLDAARQRLAMIVKRDTGSLDEKRIYSAVVESVSESMVDGVTGPLFYYGFFGVFGAFAYRIVNTADSMLGYKSRLFRDLGWFAANSDRMLNLIPSRLTGLLVVPSSMLLGYDWRSSYRVMSRDARKPDSPNSGYPMSAVAGALHVRLEKAGHYTIGDGDTGYDRRHVMSAISLMKVTAALFAMIVSIPAMLLVSYAGWWVHA